MESAEGYRIVVNRGGDITRDITFKNKKEAKELFKNILIDFCLTHNPEKKEQIESQVDDGIFVSQKFGFSASMTEIHTPAMA